tara:strand:- start:182 stop:409 length:228 start_codon:yes stop_codon:yes gene_type:complete
MKTFNEIQKQLFELTRNEKEKLEEMCNSLNQIKNQGKVTEDGLKSIQNIQTELSLFSSSYLNRLINLLKQNHMLD